jgi:hypothetical protein
MAADAAAAGDATVTIIRNAPDDVQDRWIRLWLDGEFWEILRYGMTLSRTVTPGRHRVKAHNTLTSDTIEFDAAPGEQITVRCYNAIARGGYLTILTLGIAVIRVRLERDPVPVTVSSRSSTA